MLDSSLIKDLHTDLSFIRKFLACKFYDIFPCQSCKGIVYRNYAQPPAKPFVTEALPEAARLKVESISQDNEHMLPDGFTNTFWS